jgi:hypothetical protein
MHALLAQQCRPLDHRHSHYAHVSAADLFCLLLGQRMF